MLFAWLNVGATELDGATDVEDPSEVTLDETVVPQAAKTTASVDINVPFLICMFIVYLLMNSYKHNIKVAKVKMMKIS
jgi:hypothetical protein